MGLQKRNDINHGGGLYIHIPFCHSKCAYCDFHSFPATSAIGKAVRSNYVDALLSELRLRSNELPHPLTTVYIGGGTPSLLTADELKRIVDALPLDDVVEFTIEANPEDITAEWVHNVASLSINRVSIGIQSLNDNELVAVGRRHSAAQAMHSLTLLAEGGIDNVSADLIYGLPGQTLESWAESVDTLLRAPITHLSAYSLMYEPGTRLTAMLKTGRINRTDEDVEDAMYRLLTSRCHEAGFEHYEISNFALPGRRARHNSNYWNMTPYLGLGPGAHSFDGNNIRRDNPGDSRRYVEALLHHSTTIFEVETESATDQINDMIITSLRTIDGLSTINARAMFGDKAVDALISRCQPMLNDGRLVTHDNGTRIAIPEDHWLVSNAILRDLLQ